MNQMTAHPGNAGGNNNETFSEMADATIKKPGVFGKLLMISLIVVSIAVTAFVGYAIVNNIGSRSYIDEDLYQVVLLASGQSFYGKLSDVDKEYAVLEDVYYLDLEVSQSDLDALKNGDSQEQVNPRLIKRGGEIHGPTDRMVINTDHIIFWENLREDGLVTKGIAIQKSDKTGTATIDENTPTDTGADSDSSSE